MEALGHNKKNKAVSEYLNAIETAKYYYGDSMENAIDNI
jgi:hypothetical protein